MLLENVGDRAAPHLMAQVGQRSLDSAIAPISILGGHTYHQLLDLVFRTRTAWAPSLAAIILLGDQPPMPGQERGRRHQSAHFMKHAPTRFLALTAKRLRWSSLKRSRLSP